MLVIVHWLITRDIVYERNLMWKQENFSTRTVAVVTASHLDFGCERYEMCFEGNFNIGSFFN